MDNPSKYQRIVIDVLNDYHSYLSNSSKFTRPEVIIDVENNHFQLLLIGWNDYRYIFNVAFHLDIINEKIWLQQNNTELDIVDELVAKGVPKTDIVLGFIAPAERQYTDFAVA